MILVNYTFKGDVASKWMCILCTDPSCQNQFILTAHWISCGDAAFFDEWKVWKRVMAAWTRTGNMHFLKRPRLLLIHLFFIFRHICISLLLFSSNINSSRKFGGGIGGWGGGWGCFSRLKYLGDFCLKPLPPSLFSFLLILCYLCLVCRKSPVVWEDRGQCTWMYQVSTEDNVYG